MSKRLADLTALPAAVAQPGYTPPEHGIGIVHIGPGAFFKAHQAVYTDDALTAAGGDWRIAAYSLRSDQASNEMTPQNGLFTLLERGEDTTKARVIGSVAEVGSLLADRPQCLSRLTDPGTRIVTVCVTEKGYGLDRSTGALDLSHPAIAADLAQPEQPVGLAGLMVQALAERRKQGLAPFSAVSCDNLPENGALLHRLLVAFAEETDPEMAQYISEHVACPSCMVDRITPARTAATLTDARKATGLEDQAAEETEPFRQWIIEDRFSSGRPCWEAGGAVFVKDVRPYELMKLRMLNGAHSLIAYAGILAGHQYVRDAVQDSRLLPLVRAHLDAAAATLPPIDDLDLETYQAALLKRFANPAIAHQTAQIAMDGTEKLPQRIFAPAFDSLTSGQRFDSFAFTTATWIRYTLQYISDPSFSDPRAGELAKALAGHTTATGIVGAVNALPRFLPEALAENPNWNAEVVRALERLLHGPVLPE